MSLDDFGGSRVLIQEGVREMQDRLNGIRDSRFKESDLRVDLDKIQIKIPDRIQVSEIPTVEHSKLPSYFLFGALFICITLSFLI